MKGLSALVVAAVVLGGCKGQSPPGSDPFFGRTTVPAPPTGAVPGRAADPYYRGAPSGATVPSPTPQWSAPSPGVLPGGATSGNKYAPPSVIRIVEPEGRPKPAGATGALVAASDAKTGADVAAAPSTGAPASTAGAAGKASLAGRPMVVRTLQAKPRPSDAAPGSPATASTSTATLTRPASVGSTTFAPTPATPAGFTPRPAPTPARSVDIMDLPPAGSSTSSTGANTSSADAADLDDSP